MRKEDVQERRRKRMRETKREGEIAERRCNGVGLCIESAVAGRTCRDHGGLMRLRKRRPHDRADAFQTRSFVRFCTRFLFRNLVEQGSFRPCITRFRHHSGLETRACAIPDINLVKHSTSILSPFRLN